MSEHERVNSAGSGEGFTGSYKLARFAKKAAAPESREQREYLRQTALQDELRKPDFVSALHSANVTYLLNTQIGKNILDELGIADVRRLSLLEAGALAFSLGMLAARNSYMEKYQAYLEDPKFFDRGQEAGYKKSANLDAGKVQADPQHYGQDDLIEMVQLNPDMSMSAKVKMLQSLGAGNASGVTNTLLGERMQSYIINTIKVEAAPIFEKLKSEGRIVGVSVDQAVQMPDGLLAAVGDATISTGLGKTLDPYGVGVGYFMYGKDRDNSLWTPDQRRTYSQELASGDPTPYFQKALNIAFPASGDLGIRMSAYGFDPGQGNLTTQQALDQHAPYLNQEPTRVALMAGMQIIMKLAFRPDPMTHKVKIEAEPILSQVPPAYRAIRYEISGNNSVTVTVPASLATMGPVKCVTFTTPVRTPSGTNADRDEIQVQFSTTGKIVQNRDEVVTINPIQPVIIERNDNPVITTIETPGEKILDVLFAVDKDIIVESDPNTKAALDGLLQLLRGNIHITIELRGYTDSTGDDDYNQGLSERRAKAVMEYLQRKGVDRSRMTFKGFGEKNPIEKNDTPEHRHKNRRVTYIITSQ